MAMQLRDADPAETTPLAAIDVTDPSLYANDSWRPVFARLSYFCQY